MSPEGLTKYKMTLKTTIHSLVVKSSLSVCQ